MKVDAICMKNILLVVLFLAAIQAFADNLYFYGGDLDPNNFNANGLANETDVNMPGSPYGAATYQNFVVSGNIGVTALFTNDLMSLSPATAYWEIRTGISRGHSGTLIASGDGVDTVTATGRSLLDYKEFTNLVSTQVSLTPGTYWFAVVPDGPNQNGRSYNSNTFGLNSVGQQNSDQQFLNSPFLGANFLNADDLGFYPTFSSGVYVLPELSSLIMVGSGLLAGAAFLRRTLRH